jgi:hypothetical protein
MPHPSFYLNAAFNPKSRGSFQAFQEHILVSSQKVGANPCGCPRGQAQDLPLPQDIEKIHILYVPDRIADG